MFLKICCIQDETEAALALEHGAAALGLVAAMPSGPGPIPEARIAEISAWVGSRADTFLLTALVDADSIAEQHARCRTRTLQLVDHIEEDERLRLRRLLPGVRIVQVVHVGGVASIDVARAATVGSDAILLDSGDASKERKELGGTGRVHDWEISRQIVEAVDVPVWLAGGLRAENVGRATSRVQPQGVDLCNGVRTDGRLDAAKLAAFVRALHA